MVGRDINNAVTLLEQFEKVDNFVKDGCRHIIYILGNVDISCK